MQQIINARPNVLNDQMYWVINIINFIIQKVMDRNIYACCLAMKKKEEYSSIKNAGVFFWGKMSMSTLKFQIYITVWLYVLACCDDGL